MTIRIVTDSTADLPEEVCAEHHLTVIPLYVNIEGRSYLDGVELSRKEFYEGLPRYAATPTTSAPGTGVFLQAYQKLADEGASGILTIHIAASLSNTFSVAQLAAEEMRGIPVTVFDGGQITLGTGLLALEAAKAAQAGASMDDIVALLRDLTTHTHSFAALDTVQFLRRSGRLSALQFALGTLLQIKPLLKMHQGEIGLERVRTSSRAVERLIELANELGSLEHVSVVHTHAPERAEALRQRWPELFPSGQPSFTAEVTPVIGAHVGPGAVGLVCIKARSS